MKKRILTYLGMAFLACMVSAPLFAQFNLNMPFNTGIVSQTVTNAGGNFYDNGGPGANYTDNSNPATSGVTFIPATAGQRVAVTFTTFQTEGNFDALYIYNGTDNAAPQITTGQGGNMIPCTALGPNPAPAQGGPAGGFWTTNLAGRKVFSTSPDGRLHFRFISDTSVTQAGWTATVVQEPSCAPVAPANVIASTGPNCGPNTATVNVPAVPACAAGGSIGVSIDGGAIVTATPPTFTTPLLNPGLHILTWYARDVNGCSVGSVTSTVNIFDNIPPTITCPANVNFNLIAGECNTVLTYNLPTVTDNCPWGPGGATVNTINTSGNGNSAGGMIFFNLTNSSAGSLTLTGLTMNITGPTNVQLYYKSGTHVGFETNAGAWTTGPLLNANAGPFSGPFPGNGTLTPVTIPGGLVIPTGVTGIGLRTISASSNYTNGANTYTDGTLTITTGYASNGLFIAGFTPRTFNGSVTYATVVPPPVPTQTAGLPPGSQFPVGTTQNCFTVTDFAGNSSSCCFNVTVIEFPNPTQNLACNDNVQISLDQNCTAAIGADQILEGGPYGCYDTRYTVMLITPLGGIISPAIVNANYIGNGPHTVKVVDNVTGQSCWGSIIVEDKLAPVIVCQDIAVDCSADLNDPAILMPSPAFFDPQPAFYSPAGPPLTYPGGFWVYAFGDRDGLFFDIENTTTVPISINGLSMSWLNAGSTLMSVYVTNTANTYAGNQFVPSAWDPIIVDKPTPTTGTGIEGQVPFDGPTIVLQPGEKRGMFVYSLGQEMVFTNGGGVFTNGDVQITANPGVVVGERFAPGLGAFQPYQPVMSFSYAIELAQVDPFDNCTNPVNLTHVDNFADGTCGGPSGTLTRTWTATDNYGNSASCIQHIIIERPTLDDVDIPEDVQWTCEQYDAFPNIIDTVHLHAYITDTDPSTEIINVNLDPNCDDLDLNLNTPFTQDNPAINATNIANGGIGCPGSNPFAFPPTNGLDDADVLALTGSGVPTINGLPLKGLCEISTTSQDLLVNVCPGTFKIIRRWTLIDWCANPADVRHFDQLIKVVDDKAPTLELFAVAGDTENNYGTHSIPALGNGGGCAQEPQLSGGTKYFAHVQLPQSQTPEFYQQVRLAKLWLNIDHEKLSDLDIFLKAPNGKVVEISSNNGGSGTKIAADFYDAAPGDVTLSQFNTIGDFRPEGSGATSCGGFGATYTNGVVDNQFADFSASGLNGWANDMLGNWELIIFDENAPATGKVVEWKLFFTYTSLNIDVYDAAVPQNSGAPHAVCQGTVNVPPVSAYDNCSGVAGYTTELWTIVPGTQNSANPLPMNQLGSISGNGGNFFNIPLFGSPVPGAPSQYIVRYYAVDGCGNQTFVQTKITLRDKVPPVPNCISYTEVSIANDGLGTGTSCARVWAEDLNNASYDNCKPVYFLMAKMSDSNSPNIFNRCYYPYRDFCCDDLGDNQVILLVLDTDPTPLFTNLNNPGLGCDGTPGLFLNSSFVSNTQSVNFNTCMVNVHVADKLPPILVSCPANQRISCDWFADNVETQLASLTTAQAKCDLFTSLNFGSPIYYDNCATNTTCNFTGSLDQCLEGSFLRTWTTTDNAGNTALQACTQRIFVDHVSDWAVSFPKDIEVNCDPNGTQVPDFGEPVIYWETCELVAVTSDDHTFAVQGTDACFKLVRDWTVINWCVVGNVVDQEVVEQSEQDMQNAGLSFPACDVNGDGTCDRWTFRDSWRSGPSNPNRPTVVDATRQFSPDTDPDTDPWDGYIVYQQVIKVKDSVKPIFTNGCTIPDVCIEDNSCVATVLLPEPEITECTDQYTVTAQIKIGGVWVSGFGPHTNLAPGTYDVRYVAQDFCNNQTECLSTVTVKDCKKPTPYCKNGLVIELMQTGMVTTWASDFDAGSFDNCPGALKLSFSANVNNTFADYTCDDLGQQQVQIWVTDAAGNQDYCETFVIIQANMGQCDDDPLVAGTIANESNAGVENVNVNVNSPAGFDNMLTTNTAGYYGVNVPVGGDYTITPQYDEDPLNGVSTFDLVLISKHILGVTPLGSPYKIIAADANNSKTVSTFDLVEIRKLILFINSDFPNNTSWRFVDKSFTFPNASNPWATVFPEVISLNDVTADQINNNFVAVKIGDVNGSAAVNLLGAAEDRTMVGDLVFNAEDIKVEAGKPYTVEFKATDFNVSGFQFSLNFDKKALEFVGVESGLADASNFGTTLVNEGVLTASWNSDEAKRLATGEVVFSLTFKALQSGQLSGMLNINSSYTVAEAYNSNNELMDVAMSFNNKLVSGAFDLYQNTPNPFASVTTIGFYLPEATSATLTISDVQGKVVKVINGNYVKGYNTETVKRSDLGASGVLYYRLDTGSNSATRKMILVD